jgi:Immunoglobulin domain
MDCDFTVDSNETGFVLKWHHNSAAIYQWIPSKKKPFVIVSITFAFFLNLKIFFLQAERFRGRVDVNTISSGDDYKKYSSLIISKPSVNDSGIYTCYVQTFQSK